MSSDSLAYIPSPSGLSLSKDERQLFRDCPPWGVILMGRSIKDQEQVSALTSDIRDAVGRNCLIFIDQEGGRVARLKPPNWPTFPSGQDYEELYHQDSTLGLEAVYLGYQLIASELIQIGINANCAPVADIRVDGASDVIGDRSFGKSAEIVASLAREALNGMSSLGVVGVVKHIPGHGRAVVDSHESLPKIEAESSELAEDFAAFQKLKDAPMAMTGHLAYQTIAPDISATHSTTVINDIIRNRIGFEGVLMSDDIGMQALEGSLSERTKLAIEAGCDIVLHCAGFKSDPFEIVNEMREVAESVAALSIESTERCKRAEHYGSSNENFSVEESWNRMRELFPKLSLP